MRRRRFLFVDRKGAVSIWRVISPLAADLVKDGHAVAFARLDDGSKRPPAPAPADVAVHDIPVPGKTRLLRSTPQHIAFARQFLSLLQAFLPDVVHTNFCVPGVVARTVARKARVPFVVSTQHEIFGSMNPLYRLAVRLTERQADAIVYVSRAVAVSFGHSAANSGPSRSHEGWPHHVVIHNGVDTGALEEARRRAGPVKPGRLVCPGRLVEVKGQRTLIEALPAVLARRAEVRLVLLGEGPDQCHLRRLAERNSVEAKIEFHSWAPHQIVLDEMATADAVVLPSLPVQEGFGLTLVEAMGVGAPVIASRIPVFEEVSGEASQNVRFFLSGDPASLAEAILNTLDRPHAPSDERVPDPAVASRFSVPRMVSRYRELYDFLTLSWDARSA